MCYICDYKYENDIKCVNEFWKSGCIETVAMHVSWAGSQCNLMKDSHWASHIPSVNNFLLIMLLCIWNTML